MITHLDCMTKYTKVLPLAILIS